MQQATIQIRDERYGNRTLEVRSHAAPLHSGDAGTAQTAQLMWQKVNGEDLDEHGHPSEEGDTHPGVRAWAVQAVRGTPDRDDWAQAVALFEAVQRNIRFLGEKDELVQTPWLTLQLGAGDCDDFTVLLVALLRSIGIPATFKTVEVNGDGAFNHVYAMVGIRRQGKIVSWQALDPTVAEAEPGWQPPNATREKFWNEVPKERPHTMQTPELGGFFSFMKKAVKVGEGAVEGFAAGGPAGAVAGGARATMAQIAQAQAAKHARLAALLQRSRTLGCLQCGAGCGDGHEVCHGVQGGYAMEPRELSDFIPSLGAHHGGGGGGGSHGGGGNAIVARAPGGHFHFARPVYRFGDEAGRGHAFGGRHDSGFGHNFRNPAARRAYWAAQQAAQLAAQQAGGVYGAGASGGGPAGGGDSGSGASGGPSGATGGDDTRSILEQMLDMLKQIMQSAEGGAQPSAANGGQPQGQSGLLGDWRGRGMRLDVRRFSERPYRFDARRFGPEFRPGYRYPWPDFRAERRPGFDWGGLLEHGLDAFEHHFHPPVALPPPGIPNEVRRWA
jgi:hypothetical protein